MYAANRISRSIPTQRQKVGAGCVTKSPQVVVSPAFIDGVNGRRREKVSQGISGASTGSDSGRGCIGGWCGIGWTQGIHSKPHFLHSEFVTACRGRPHGQWWNPTKIISEGEI